MLDEGSAARAAHRLDVALRVDALVLTLLGCQHYLGANTQSLISISHRASTALLQQQQKGLCVLPTHVYVVSGEGPMSHLDKP